MILWNITSALFKQGFNALLNWLERREYDKANRELGASQQRDIDRKVEDERIDRAIVAGDADGLPAEVDPYNRDAK